MAESEDLTPQQKAARTRAANRAAGKVYKKPGRKPKKASGKKSTSGPKPVKSAAEDFNPYVGDTQNGFGVYYEALTELVEDAQAAYILIRERELVPVSFVVARTIHGGVTVTASMVGNEWLLHFES